MSKIISGNQIGSASRMHVMSRVDFQPGTLCTGACWKVDCNARRFRPVPVRAVIGQAAALGRPPYMREMTFYSHLMGSSNYC